MSHRKFSAPRHGSLGFLPRKRCTHHQGKLRSFPTDKAEEKPHFTAFIGYKAGMTHVIRDYFRLKSGLHKKEICEACTILDCPPMVVVGMVGYEPTEAGLRAVTTVWAKHLSDEVRRRFYKNWYRAKHKSFTRYAAKHAEESTEIKDELARMKAKCTVIRVIAHTQPSLLPITQRKAHIMEVQINGGSVSDKVDFGYGYFEQKLNVADVFSVNECIDHASISKGHGYEGVIHRYGISVLPRKTRRGARRVACVGPWNPSRVFFSVARSGQRGYHHRTEMNKKVMLMGNGTDARSGATEFDITDKTINPMGGFQQYGLVKNDFIMIRGSVPGARKRPVTLRKACKPPAGYLATEEITLKYIDTTSKIGHGRFATSAAKAAHYGH